MDRRERGKRVIMLSLAAVMTLILVFGKNEKEQEPETVTTAVELPEQTPANPVSDPAILAPPAPTKNPEESVYSFLQGPKSWDEQRDWSGKWGNEYHDGGSFGGFGCGFCCMANIYSTMTEYKCNPLDIYSYSKKVTYYGGGGAISWQFMRKTMAKIGFDVKLREKPSTYREFKIDTENAQAMLVLVSSYNDDSYWKNTPGHYVTLFLYNPETEKVFLTDSGDPEHNRHWVPLKTIYKALKTSSDFQYMAVTAYDESKDEWKHKSAKGAWVEPEYIKTKEGNN